MSLLSANSAPSRFSRDGFAKLDLELPGTVPGCEV